MGAGEIRELINSESAPLAPDSNLTGKVALDPADVCLELGPGRASGLSKTLEALLQGASAS